jgi:hypothetical protein
MPTGTPQRVTDEFERRGELVRVTVSLERGALEDLEALCRHHYGAGNRSETVRRAIALLLAREAAQVVRARSIERRHAERAAEQERALLLARDERDRDQTQATLSDALGIAKRNEHPPRGVV